MSTEKKKETATTVCFESNSCLSREKLFGIECGEMSG